MIYKNHPHRLTAEGLKGQVPAPYYDLWLRLRDAIFEELKIHRWPDNACRDTFCTMHMSAYRDQQRTALVLKHRNSQTLWQSYLGTLVAKDVALAFFEF